MSDTNKISVYMLGFGSFYEMQKVCVKMPLLCLLQNIFLVLEFLFTDRSITCPTVCCMNIAVNIWNWCSAPITVQNNMWYGKWVAWLMLRRKNNNKGHNVQPESHLWKLPVHLYKSASTGLQLLYKGLYFSQNN